MSPFLFVESVTARASSTLVKAPNFKDSWCFYILQFSHFFLFLRDSVLAEDDDGRNFPLEWLNAPCVMFLTAIPCFASRVLHTFNAMLALETNL